MAKSKPETTAAGMAFDVPTSADVTPAETPEVSIVSREPPIVSPAPVVSPETPKPARQGDDTRPYCPTHYCLMRATGTRGAVTHYACPVPSCQCKEKQARPQSGIPREPQACPHLTCQSPQQFLELVPAKSNLAVHHMQCPACKFAVKQPRQQFAQMQERNRKRPPREDYSER